MRSKPPLQGELILDRGDGFLHVPLAAGRHQAIRRIEGERSSGGVEVVGEEVLERRSCRKAQQTLRRWSRYVVRRSDHVEGEERVELLIIVHDLRGVPEVPVMR